MSLVAERAAARMVAFSKVISYDDDWVAATQEAVANVPGNSLVRGAVVPLVAFAGGTLTDAKATLELTPDAGDETVLAATDIDATTPVQGDWIAYKTIDRTAAVVTIALTGDVKASLTAGEFVVIFEYLPMNKKNEVEY